MCVSAIEGPSFGNHPCHQVTSFHTNHGSAFLALGSGYGRYGIRLRYELHPPSPLPAASRQSLPTRNSLGFRHPCHQVTSFHTNHGSAFLALGSGYGSGCFGRVRPQSSVAPGMLSGTSRTVYLGNIPAETSTEEILNHVEVGTCEGLPQPILISFPLMANFFKMASEWK
jgi:hypothetical protein